MGRSLASSTRLSPSPRPESPHLIFKWRSDPRYRPTKDGTGALPFLPVEVVPEPASASATHGRNKIALSSGHRMSESGSIDMDALCRVVRAMRQPLPGDRS